MPIISMKLLENELNAKQKQELIGKLTDAVEAVVPGLRDVTFVTIEEIKERDWGIGGQPITVDIVREHAKKNLKG